LFRSLYHPIPHRCVYLAFSFLIYHLSFFSFCLTLAPYLFLPRIRCLNFFICLFSPPCCLLLPCTPSPPTNPAFYTVLSCIPCLAHSRISMIPSAFLSCLRALCCPSTLCLPDISLLIVTSMHLHQIHCFVIVLNIQGTNLYSVYISLSTLGQENLFQIKTA
jgi:hypothetical protein